MMMSVLAQVSGMAFTLALLLSPVICRERGRPPALPAHVNDTEGQSTEWNGIGSDNNINYPDFDKPHEGSQGRVSKRAVGEDNLLIANRRFIVTFDSNGTITEGYDLNLVEPSNAIGVDFDIREQKIYWTNVASGTIRRLDFAGSGVTLLASSDVTTPDGLAWDWVNKKLYWTDAAEQDIEVLDPQTGYRKVLINTGAGSMPRAIVVDPERRCMYWTDWGDVAKIERASMDGTERTVLHNTDLVWPNALTLDYDNQILYWADAQLDKFEKSSVDGTNRVLLINAIYQPFHIFGMEFYRGELYWTDWEHNAIIAGSVQQPEVVRVVHAGLVYDPMAIHVMTTERQPYATNPCAITNGGCSNLCLLSRSSRGFSCACPEPLFLATDQKRCISEVEPTTPSPDPTTQPPIICSLPCQNGGTCTATGHCLCPSGQWTGPRCEDAICVPACDNGGQCIAPDVCYCTIEWEGDYCETPICFPPSGCLHGGVCRRPGLCSCDAGWTGATCESAICTPSCVHGECIAPDDCHCDVDWSGDTCNEALCYLPDGCLNGGYCRSPGLCLCSTEWTGKQCEQAVCNPSCVNGDCIEPDECFCNVGWTGSRCLEAECYPPCNNGGTCILPGHCVCSRGWSGDRCQTIAFG